MQKTVWVGWIVLAAACSGSDGDQTSRDADIGGFLQDASGSFRDVEQGFPDVPLEVDAEVDAGLAEEDVGFFDGGFVDAADAQVSMGPAEINLTFAGACGADFGGDVVVSNGAFFTVSSLRNGVLQASLQVDLGDATGAQIISTRGRLETGLTVTVLTAATWTNASPDPDVIAGQAPDPVEGTLLISDYRPAEGRSDLAFVNVVLVNPDDESECTVNGNIRTSRLGS